MIDCNGCDIKFKLEKWDSSELTNVEKYPNGIIVHSQPHRMDTSEKGSKQILFMTVSCNMI